MYDIACDYYEKELELIPEEKKRELAVALNDYGVLLEEMGCLEEAADCLMKAFAIQEELFGPDHPEIISTFNNLGLICTDMGDYKAAESFYRRALRISLEYYKEGHPETAVLYGNLGELIMHCCQNIEEDAENEAIIDAEAIADTEAPAQSDAPEDTKSRLAEARHYLMRALEITTDAYGPSYPDNACTLNNLGLLEDLEGNHKKAREHYRKALEIQRAATGGDHPHLADILHNLGVSYIDEALKPFSSPESFSSSSVEQKKDALPLLRKALACEKKALAILAAVFDSTHPSVEMLQNEVEWLENELG
jgi:tetratricopeptide (TPR) repeat protein